MVLHATVECACVRVCVCVRLIPCSGRGAQRCGASSPGGPESSPAGRHAGSAPAASDASGSAASALPARGNTLKHTHKYSTHGRTLTGLSLIPIHILCFIHRCVFCHTCALTNHSHPENAVTAPRCCVTMNHSHDTTYLHYVLRCNPTRLPSGLISPAYMWVDRHGHL